MLNLDELLLDGKEGCGMARGDVQFTIDGAQVGIDRARADDQYFSDLGIGEALCHQPQHLHLTLGQVVRRGG